VLEKGRKRTSMGDGMRKNKQYLMDGKQPSENYMKIKYNQMNFILLI
jgi:hypothetical protein